MPTRRRSGKHPRTFVWSAAACGWLALALSHAAGADSHQPKAMGTDAATSNSASSASSASSPDSGGKPETKAEAETDKGSGTMSSASDADSEFPTPRLKYNYVVGYQTATSIMMRMQQQGVPLDASAIGAGFKDALESLKPRISEQDAIAAVKALQSELQTAGAGSDTEREAKGAKNAEAGAAYLAENKTKPNIVTRDSGLQYEVLKAGTGASPKDGQVVMVHYEGKLIDGSVFDSSVQRGQPAKFSTGGVIPGFKEALLNMKEGGKWRVFIPSVLAYGPNGAGKSIGPNETLVFELELIEVMEQ